MPNSGNSLHGHSAFNVIGVGHLTSGHADGAAMIGHVCSTYKCRSLEFLHIHVYSPNVESIINNGITDSLTNHGTTRLECSLA